MSQFLTVQSQARKLTKIVKQKFKNVQNLSEFNCITAKKNKENKLIFN